MVDVDLEKFFDNICHDRLIGRLRGKIHDWGVIRLIRAYLNSGTLLDGVVVTSSQGGSLLQVIERLRLYLRG